jgi:predicted dithiol-disulfide oxidoreductase (DUF899 family)
MDAKTETLIPAAQLARRCPVRFPNKTAEYRAARTALLVPLWDVLDTTPDGRATDWYPKLQYGA